MTEGRFEPQLFDANIQTDRDLMELYFAKEITNTEVATDRLKVEQKSLMIQTDPLIEELWLMEEPAVYELPV